MGDGAQGRVLGIGGVFVRARDPAALAAWYRDHLGIAATCSGEPGPDGSWSWRQDAGETVFAMFAAGSDYFAADRQVMLNFRVTGLDDLAARLEAAGIAVERRAEWDHPDVGRFARIGDPEGNPIELWEPPAAA
ncbi:VOC family protein [Novosphingobium album (ex Liu et al. 2023)]|uniref:VOC family protein n=1 Tax=Novosphingobium album (ex Liu et al. 2023) TaxID=3031130 RepID=A0ABT5WJJ8_9SPHN|nr:VOC family protein [Novosphingobium album (ex Liu et al. 2023)]MDE8650220.1 VOC family protein [Novosphingobium album (ex Liu et al. 2023)]